MKHPVNNSTKFIKHKIHEKKYVKTYKCDFFLIYFQKNDAKFNFTNL